MRFLSFFFLGLLGLALTSSPAWARRNADMFIDKQISTYDRPWVPSDKIRGEDMFHPPEVFLNGKADLFGHVRPTTIATREDMLRVHRKQRPYSPIFTNDDWTN